MSDCSIVVTYLDHSGNFQMEKLRATKSLFGYQIESIPQFAPSVSKGDIVLAVPEEDELYFEMVLEPSWNSTIQVIFFDEKAMEPAITYLETLGCHCELSRENKLLAVNIPNGANYSKVQIYFEKGEEDGKWTFKESCLSHY